jgi:hypothetical protein
MNLSVSMCRTPQRLPTSRGRDAIPDKRPRRPLDPFHQSAPQAGSTFECGHDNLAAALVSAGTTKMPEAWLPRESETNFLQNVSCRNPDFRGTSRTGDLASSQNPSSRHRRLSRLIGNSVCRVQVFLGIQRYSVTICISHARYYRHFVHPLTNILSNSPEEHHKQSCSTLYRRRS